MNKCAKKMDIEDEIEAKLQNYESQMQKYKQELQNKDPELEELKKLLSKK